MRQFLSGIVVALVVIYFTNSELRIGVMGWFVGASRNLYRIGENAKTDFGKKVAERVQQYTVYQSSWQIERIKIAETPKGYEYHVSAKHPASGMSVFYKTPDLKLIPDRNLYYTITLGSNDTTEIETLQNPAQEPVMPREGQPSEVLQDTVSY